LGKIVTHHPAWHWRWFGLDFHSKLPYPNRPTKPSTWKPKPQWSIERDVEHSFPF
jgi:hypothetical protein